jgi:hypothetical protein
MKQTEFLILMHCDMYVDPNLLEKGLYGKPTPSLYSLGTTIESLVKQAQDINNMRLSNFISFSDTYISNLKLCTLQKVKLELL